MALMDLSGINVATVIYASLYVRNSSHRQPGSNGRGEMCIPALESGGNVVSELPFSSRQIKGCAGICTAVEILLEITCSIAAIL